MGDPEIKGTPFNAFLAFNDYTKKFYGRISESTFRITKNAWLNPIPYIINGAFTPKNTHETEVVIKIQPMVFGYLWIRILPIAFILVFNIFMVVESSQFEYQIFLFGNLFMSIFFLPIIIVNHRKKKFIKEFLSILELDN
jgi:hypothetical protein